ncbi:chaplin [Streptomyces sp. NPDC005963]|uniref:chaplin n=1 Tax=Streptomyces sp. NPDC005963 TaxID=3156721 RepID=UPI00340DC5D7
MNLRTTAVALVLVAGAILGGAGTAAAGSDADGTAAVSPGVLSGNTIQIPVRIPLNICGNTVDVLLGVLNPAGGSLCINTSDEAH